MTETLSHFTSLPELLSSQDLITLGLFSSPDAAYVARLHGNSPDFIKLRRKILYPKSSVIQFIEDRLKKGCIPKESH
jgi:hypothetical protein